MKMCHITKRRALSTVVSTLIIMVVSALLVTVVAFYTINVTGTRVQEESLYIFKQHIWCNASGGWAKRLVRSQTQVEEIRL